jgi:hypothetical protein
MYSQWQDHINKKSFAAVRLLTRLLFHLKFGALLCAWQFIKRVIFCQLLYWAFTQDRAMSLLRSTILISYLLLAFVLGVWIEFLSHRGVAVWQNKLLCILGDKITSIKSIPSSKTSPKTALPPCICGSLLCLVTYCESHLSPITVLDFDTR